MTPSERDVLKRSIEESRAEVPWARIDIDPDAVLSLLADVEAAEAEKAKVRADLAPLHNAMSETRQFTTAEMWGQNVCEYAARELIDLRTKLAAAEAERDEFNKVWEAAHPGGTELALTAGIFHHVLATNVRLAADNARLTNEISDLDARMTAQQLEVRELEAENARLRAVCEAALREEPTWRQQIIVVLDGAALDREAPR